MQEQFVPYNSALKLRELGFNELCFCYVNSLYKSNIIKEGIKGCVNSALNENEVALPLWQQAFDWFREKHNLDSEIYMHHEGGIKFYTHLVLKLEGKVISHKSEYVGKHSTYQEARQACLEKLITILEENQKS